MKTERWMIGAVASCNNCEFTEEDYKKAHRSGKAHAKKTGHHVMIEITYCYEYKHAPVNRVPKGE